MTNLTDRDEERFAELRENLKGVAPHEPESKRVESAPGPLNPMLASPYDGHLKDLELDRWIAEQKFDGTRIVLQKFDGEVDVHTRRHVERSETLSELVELAAETLPDGVILDGEYTFLNLDGNSKFVPITARDEKIEAAELTPRYVVFDVLAVEHVWCTRKPLEERKEQLEDLVPDGDLMAPIEVVESNILRFYDEIADLGEEGIILKRRGSGYHVGTRSDHWRKVKTTKEDDFLAVGYTAGEGERLNTFGALVLTDGSEYVGRVGSGFSTDELESLIENLNPVVERSVPLSDVGSEYQPIEPVVVRVKYLELSSRGNLRAPVFVRIKPEKPLDAVQPIERSEDPY